MFISRNLLLESAYALQSLPHHVCAECFTVHGYLCGQLCAWSMDGGVKTLVIVINFMLIIPLILKRPEWLGRSFMLILDSH